MVKNETKSFLNNLSIAKKTAVLVVIVTIGTLLIGGVAHFGVNSMKDKYQTFYDKRFTAIETLDKVREIYTDEIQRRVLDISNKQGKVVELSREIEAKKVASADVWKEFLALHYQSLNKEDASQQAMVDALQEQVLQVNKTIDEALNTLNTQGQARYVQKSYAPLLRALNDLDMRIAALVRYQFELSAKEKVKIHKQYDRTQFWVFAMTALVLFLSLLFTMMIANNFQILLQNLSIIVEKRNRENDNMHRILEQRVDEAVEKARGQDQIMYQHARLASMGEMIGNIAHQWRQPLNAITLLIQSFGTKSLSGKLDQAFIDSQVDEGMRLAVSMSNTIEDFRNFFSPSKEKEYFDVQKSTDDTLEMSSFFCKDENIDIQVVCKEAVSIHGYANEFSQVILNFINNARDNFKEKQVSYDKRIEILIQKDSESVSIYFTDNGGGIEPAIIDRIFEPYFTTKHKASGTGIGLYMSQQIIEVQMGGEISVHNVDKVFDEVPFRGAQFKITLPLS